MTVIKKTKRLQKTKKTKCQKIKLKKKTSNIHQIGTQMIKFTGGEGGCAFNLLDRRTLYKLYAEI